MNPSRFDRKTVISCTNFGFTQVAENPDDHKTKSSSQNNYASGAGPSGPLFYAPVGSGALGPLVNGQLNH